MAIKCPKCNNVSETDGYTKYIKEGNQFRRNRKCTSCGFKFKTIEVFEEDYLEATELARSLVNLIKKHLYQEKEES